MFDFFNFDAVAQKLKNEHSRGATIYKKRKFDKLEFCRRSICTKIGKS